MKKLAIIITHPIQYYAPVFKLLHQRKQISIQVYYTWGENAANKFDPGFNKKIEWDIPLLDGYPYKWVKNSSKEQGSHHFKGMINPDLINDIRSWNADAVLVYGWGYYSHLKTIRYFKGKIPVFFRGDSTLLDEQKGAKNVLKTVFLKWVYHHVDTAFYVGANNKAYFKKYGLKDKQLIFAPHAVDNNRFAISKIEEVKVLKADLGIKDEELIVIFAGKLEEKKAPVQLLDAFLAINMSAAHLIFVGNGRLEDELKVKAKHNTRVHFIGFQNQSQMPVFLQACDVFCLPSTGPNETWGLIINEAMACSKAILTTDKVGGAIDLVQPGKNGLIFKAGSLNHLTESLKTLLETGKDELYQMGKNSGNIISDWSFENQVTTIETAIKSL